jgi:hypothetical protein
MSGLALKSDGTVVGWGANDWYQATPPARLTNVVAIAAGGDHSLALVAQPPSLHAQASGMNLVLSWPVWAAGYTLEASGTVGGTNSWNGVTNTPVAVDSENTVTDALSGRSQFYRLRKQ